MWSKNNQIKIQPGQRFQNKSLKYLYPSIQLTNKSIYAYILNRFTILATGVGDLEFNEKSILDNTFYILVDVFGPYHKNKYASKEHYTNKFTAGLAMIKQKKGFVTDYTYDKNYHMIVVELPYEDMKLNFLQGKYSQLYPNVEDINLLFPKIIKEGKIESRNQDNLVLHKDNKGRPGFRNLLKAEFGYPEDIAVDIELDLPPIFKEEVFNNHLLI